LSIALTRGEFVGQDELGNQYFRKMEWDPDLGIEKEQRWMKSPRGYNHVYNYDPNRTPVEWTGWLRGSRPDPPTEQEIQRNASYRHQVNLQVQQLKQKELRRQRIQEEENDAEEEGDDGETLTLGEPGENVQYWKPGEK